jgi:hypothetical protein
MRRWIAAAVVAASVSALGAAPALAQNPPGTGQPGQSCQDFSATTRPGGSGSSPGAPFNEPGINSAGGGTSGGHYSETSQYDVACFQWAQHHQ